MELNDKRALISGSTKGIGVAIARQLAAEGARVILNGRSGGGRPTASYQLCFKYRMLDGPRILEK